MATEDDKPNSGLIGTVTIAGAIAMVAICAVLTALVRSEQNSEDDRKNAEANLKPLTELRAEQEQVLKAAPSYADDKKERITLPLDRAMTAVVKDIQDNPQAATAPGSEPTPEADADAGAGDAGAEATDGGTPAEGDAAAPDEGDGQKLGKDQKLDGKDKKKKKPAPKQGESGTQPPPGEGAE